MIHFVTHREKAGFLISREDSNYEYLIIIKKLFDFYLFLCKLKII